MLARALSWGFNRGLVVANPCERGGRLYRGSRAEIIWTDADEAVFLKRPPAHLHLPLLLALWTGQRQGDFLRLPWSAYDGEYIRRRQSPKAGPGASRSRSARRLKPRLMRHRNTFDDQISDQQREQAVDIGRLPGIVGQSLQGRCVAGVTFHDLRGTAVTRFALMEATEAEIAYITGLSLRGVRAILDSHYLSRDPALGDSAIMKLERRTKTPD